ncbi:MAG TPA: hypothetical protein VMZ50_05695 [Phycisphaerae bacterium]|nr:hypothetical protein [Phycisphaerae bacterium]
MAKTKSNPPRTPLDEIREIAEVAPGVVDGVERRDIEMVTVRAMTRVMDNGNRYAPGDVLHMEIHLVPAHVAAGQVEVIPRADVPAAVEAAERAAAERAAAARRPRKPRTRNW